MAVASGFWIAHARDMRRLARDKRYLRVRRWIDRDIATQYKPPSIGFSMLGTIIAAMGFKLVGGPISFVIWFAVLSASVVWTGFVLWRAGRMMQASSIKGDRQYDQHGKYLLPPEYANSESATAARRRKRMKRHGS